MSYIVTIAGNASASAPTASALEATRRLLRRNGLHSDAIVVRNLPAADLLHGRLDSPALEAAHCLIAQAQGIVIATPLQETTYSGLLKTFLDTLPPNALQEKTLLPITVGGCRSALISREYALRPVLTALGANAILRPLCLEESAILFEHGGVVRLEESAETRLRDGLEALRRAVSPPSPARTEPCDAAVSPFSARSYQ